MCYIVFFWFQSWLFNSKYIKLLSGKHLYRSGTDKPIWYDRTNVVTSLFVWMAKYFNVIVALTDLFQILAASLN